MHDHELPSSDAFNALSQWFNESRLGGTPDANLLLVGLPHGGLLNGEALDEGTIEFAIRDQQEPTRTRSPYTLEAEAFLATRLLLLPKPHITIHRTDKSTAKRHRREKHYVALFPGQVQLLRVVADAAPGESVRQASDHRDMMRANLFKGATPPGKTARRTWKGRGLAIATACRHFAETDVDQHLPLTCAGYEWWLRQAFALLDERHPLGSAPVAEAAE